jgi:flagellar motor switch protein FliN/FliY
MSQEEIDAMVSNNSQIDSGENQSVQLKEPEFPEMSFGEKNSEIGEQKLELLYDLQMPVTIELGRTNMIIRDILRLGRGSVIEFDKLVSEPVDVLINGKKVAEGEVVVIDKHFGIRITTLIDPSDRLRAARKLN